MYGDSVMALGSARMHALRVIPAYFPYVTGPAKQARAISVGLAREGIDSTIVTTDLGAAQAPEREELDGVSVVRLPIRTGVLQYHIARGAWSELTRQPADLIHIHSYRSYLADVAALAARKRGIPFVLHLHGTLAGYRHIVSARGQWPYHAYDWLTSPLPTLRADQFIVSTTAEANEAVEHGVDPARLAVIPMGIDTTDYQFDDIVADPAKILFVGRIAPDRNVDLLLHALHRVRDQQWICTIVGSEERRSYTSETGYLRKLKERVDELHLTDRITFAGPQYGEELRRTYASAGIFVYPSRYENFGQAILEAAAAGCALITTPVGVATDLVRSDASGFQTGPDTPDDLVAHLSRLLANPDEQRVVGERAREIAARDYSWARIHQQYFDVYSRLLGRRSERLLAS